MNKNAFARGYKIASPVARALKATGRSINTASHAIVDGSKTAGRATANGTKTAAHTTRDFFTGVKWAFKNTKLIEKQA